MSHASWWGGGDGGMPGCCLHPSSEDVSQAVRETVPPQVAVASKHLSAVLAVVGFDVRVCQKVSLQVAALVERPRTRGALVWRFWEII